VNIATHSESFCELSDILHRISAVVRRKWARLPNRVDVSHISHWWGDYLVLILDGIIKFLVGGVSAWYQVVLIEVGVVWSS
jgi:hypothetical protein